MVEFEEIRVDMPSHDADVTLVFPNGKTVVVQSRPSNADVDYNGSLDFILPRNMPVANWYGDDMTPAKPADPRDPCTMLAKQLVTEIP